MNCIDPHLAFYITGIFPRWVLFALQVLSDRNPTCQHQGFGMEVPLYLRVVIQIPPVF